MSNRKPPDWTRTGTVEGYARSLQRNSDAICVLVIRAHDSVLAIHPDCKPEDAGELVVDYLPRLVIRVEEARKQKKAARLELGPNRE